VACRTAGSAPDSDEYFAANPIVSQKPGSRSRCRDWDREPRNAVRHEALVGVGQPWGRPSIAFASTRRRCTYAASTSSSASEINARAQRLLTRAPISGPGGHPSLHRRRCHAARRREGPAIASGSRGDAYALPRCWITPSPPRIRRDSGSPMAVSCEDGRAARSGPADCAFRAREVRYRDRVELGSFSRRSSSARGGWRDGPESRRPGHR
jgi:hypothetical protein